MNRQIFLRRAAALAVAATPLAGRCVRAAPADGWVVIGNAPIRGLDLEMLKRIYTGRVIEVDGPPVRPVNLPPGTPVRRRFFSGVLQLEDEDYIAYWTVRRHIGQGVPPRDLRSASDVIDFVQRTPGGIGYLDPADLRPGPVVLMKR